MSIFENQTRLKERLRILFDTSEPKESVDNFRYFLSSFGRDPTYQKRFFAVIEQCDERFDMIAQLTHLHKERIKEQLNPNAKTVGVYFPSCAYRENVGDIAATLRKRGLNAVTLIGTVCNDAYESDAFVYYGGHDIISSLDFIDLIITPTPTFGLPRSAVKVMFVHDIHDSPLGTVDDTYLRLLREYDYLFLPCSPVMKRFEGLYRLETEKELADSAPRRTGLIPGGYIKLDRNIDYANRHRSDTKTLIYAPTVTDVDGLRDVVSVPKYGDVIVKIVLEAFEAHTLVFRPHPHSLNTPEVQAIIAAFRDHPRFVLDDNPSFYMENYAKSVLMITDMSGTAYSYALSTLRPVLFFSPNEETARARYAGYQFFEDRPRVGAVVTDLRDLTLQISRLLAEAPVLEKRISDYRDGLVFNVGGALEYFVQNIEHLLEKRDHPDWVYV